MGGHPAGHLGLPGQDHLRRSQHPGAHAHEGVGAPLAVGGERHPPGRHPTPRVGEGSHDGRQCGVGGGLGGADGAEGRGYLGGHVPKRLQALDRQRAPGQGAGLVETHDVHSRQPFHGRQLLNQNVALSQAHHADGERHGREEHQALRDHPDGPRHRHPQRLSHRFGGPELAPHQQDHGGDEGPAHGGEDPVDAGPQLGADEREAACLIGQAGSVRLLPDPDGAVPAQPGDREAARQALVARLLGDGVGLAGEQRLVDLEVPRLNDLSIDDDLIAGPDLQQVVEHHLADGDLLHPAVTHHPRPRRAEQGEALQGGLGAQLLDDADGGVDDQHDPEQGILDGRHEHDDDQQRPQEDVEPGDDVGADDLLRRAAGPLGHVVDGAARHPLRHLGGGEACRRQVSCGRLHGAACPSRGRSPGRGRSARSATARSPGR